MESEIKLTPTSEPFPAPLENFIKNNPNMKCENLYLCESIDMDGNVVDTKIGVNLLTNYGLKDHFVDGNARYNEMYIWLGSGQTEPDPASASLTSYISSLGGGSGSTSYSTYYPLQFDQTTQLWSVTRKIFQNYWDYTAGSNGEYEIWELGMGHSRTTLRTHALIYDDHGQQTCIVKRPNTRLYITAYWTASISVADIPDMYNAGKYLFVNPLIAMPIYGYKPILWSNLTRGPLYNERREFEWNSYRWIWRTHNYTSIVTNDPREAHMDLGPSNEGDFWERQHLYSSGWVIQDNGNWPSRYQTDMKECNLYGMILYDLLPVPEELESYYAYTNTSFSSPLSNYETYTGTEMDQWSILRLDENFGASQIYWRDGDSPQSWSDPDGTFPCTDFHITELTMYNHLTKEWDIPVPFKDEPDTIYCDHWCRFYIKLWMNYNGSSRYVYVFINMNPHDNTGTPIGRITGFDNSNMVIAATDTYWDPSTYVEIPNLNSVPSQLQQKRYYIIVSGTVAELNPKMSRTDWHKHEIVPATMPFELTDDTNGIIPRMLNFTSSTNFSSSPYNDRDNWSEEYISNFTLGSQPLVSNSKKFFCINWMLIFCDENWNVIRYNLLLEDKYPGCKFRRYMTADCDRLIWFATRVRTNLENETTGSNNTSSFAVAANCFSVWTIVDKNTTPTRVDLDLSTMWSDSSLVNNNACWHLYSWTDVGYLVVAKRRTETEFVYVDIYGSGNGPEMHLVTDAKHARAIEKTECCVYQDMNLSEGTSYVFNIFNMSSGTVEDSFTISDGSTYTVNGVYGYNTHIYAFVTTSDNTNYIYYYNTDNHSLEKIAGGYEFMRSNFPYWCFKTTTYDDYCILTQQHASNGHTYIIHGNTWNRVFSSETVNDYASYRKCFPCLNTINDGKQLLLGLSGRENSSNTTYVLDLGLLIDTPSKTVDYVPYLHFGTKEMNSGNSRNMSGPIIPYNDGIIRMVSNTWGGYKGKVGRIWWFPPEMCMRLHMKGTTRTLQSYNAPLRWYLTKKIKWNVTNDLSRLLPQNNVGE